MKPIPGTKGRRYKLNDAGGLVVAHFDVKRDAYGPWGRPTAPDRRDFHKAKRKRAGRVRMARTASLLGSNPFR